jgi:hypothetical protein
MANLGRGLVSLRTEKGNFLSWRLLYDDPQGIEYNVYRGSTKIATTKVTNYLDAGAPPNARYSVRPVSTEAEVKAQAEVNAQAENADGEVSTLATSQDVPIQKPAGGTTLSSGTRPTPRTTPNPATRATSTWKRTS